MVARRALTFGLNYPGTSNALEGCVNDSEYWASLFTARKFASVTNLQNGKCTCNAMLDAISKLLTASQPGDLAVICYSGHGSIVSPGIQSLIPHDFKWNNPNTWLTYDKLDQELLAHEQRNVRVVLLFDSCHSAADPRKHMRGIEKDRVRFLPPPEFIVRRTRGYPFGRNIITADQDDLLLSGCRKEQTSADTSFNGKAWGAYTFACKSVLDKNPRISYQGLILGARTFLSKQNFDQSPQACGDPSLLSQPNFE
jgi:metacaspase-1